MLKITTIDTELQRRLTVAGAIAGPSAAELTKAWECAHDSLGERQLVVDLACVTVISPEGLDILREMKNHGAEFVCRGVYIKHVLRNLKSLSKAWTK